MTLSNYSPTFHPGGNQYSDLCDNHLFALLSTFTMFPSANDIISLFLFLDIIPMKSYYVCSSCCIFLLCIIFLWVIHVTAGSYSLFSLLYGNPLSDFTTSAFFYWQWFVSSLVFYEKCCYEHPCSWILMHLCMDFSKDVVFKVWPSHLHHHHLGVVRNANCRVTSQNYLETLEVGLAIWNLASPPEIMTHIKD